MKTEWYIILRLFFLGKTTLDKFNLKAWYWCSGSYMRKIKGEYADIRPGGQAAVAEPNVCSQWIQPILWDSRPHGGFKAGPCHPAQAAWTVGAGPSARSLCPCEYLPQWGGNTRMKRSISCQEWIYVRLIPSDMPRLRRNRRCWSRHTPAKCRLQGYVHTVAIRSRSCAVGHIAEPIQNAPTAGKPCSFPPITFRRA